ncbi:hypothetical protein RUND412_001691 [Rhizina undulata]
MSGVEIVLGIAGVISSGLAPVLKSTIRGLRKKGKKHQTVKRQKIINRFLNSWIALQMNVVKLVEVLPSLIEGSPDRRKVIKELQRTSKLFQEANAQLLSYMPISNALKEHEKVEEYLLQQLESSGYIAELPASSPGMQAPKVSARDVPHARERQSTPEGPTGRHRTAAGGNYNNSTHQLSPQQTRSLDDEGFFENSSHPLTQTITTTHTVYENISRSVPLQVNTSHRGNGPYYNVGGSYSDSAPILRSPSHHSPVSLHAQTGPSHSQSSVHVCYVDNPVNYSSGSQRDQMNRHW